MEEKKSKEELIKEVESKKPTYRQLEEFANQVSKQNQQLILRLRTIDNMFKRLDYLLEIHRNPEGFTEEFIKNCNKEIEEMLTPEEEDPKSKEDKEDK